MHTHLLSPSGSIGGVVAILIFIAISTCYSQEDEQYYDCNRTNYSCGPSIQNIRYPFWGDGRPKFCGHQLFELKCQKDEYPTIDINNRTFRVLEIDQTSHLMTIARSDFWDNHCPQEFTNITIDVNNLFRYSQEVRDLFIFYNCTHNDSSTSNDYSGALSNNFSCPDIDGNVKERLGFYADESFLRAQLRNLTESAGITCNVSVEVPVLREALERLSSNSWTLQEALKQGFELVYFAENEACLRCEDSGGICGSNSNSSEFVCHCRDHTDPRDCRKNENLGVQAKLLIGFSAAGFTILLMSLLFFFYHRRSKKRFWVSRNTSPYPSSIKDLEKSGTYLKVQIFSYNELEKATSHFDSKTELGDGGFGTVYRGKLRDGRVVAVKRLYEHNFKRVEQFMNEVEILTRLRHQNLVSLYGCTTHHSRELLLVYEYIPNGTVADHLHGEQAKPGSLCWTTRMSIAIETASALAYLHASDVIHRDVKTNNILLDNNFCVKVADFGLSRLFPTNVSHVSTAPQGTPGYVDPEYHECYQLTDKSDVYSFGVVLVEFISSKPAVDFTRHRHEINLSNMAINKIQNNALQELVDPHLGFGSDYKVRKMITKVAELAFQCLQNEKDSRPSMEDVLEVLKGIQSEDCAMKNAEVVDIPEDDIALLKSDALTLSPDSVTVNCISR